jgi:hypothetical protein
MKTKKFLSMAALALVGAMMTGCSSDDDILQPENKTNVVTLTATVGFDDAASTRAVTGTGTKTFAEGDQIVLFYKDGKGLSRRVVSSALTPGDITNGGKKANLTFDVSAALPATDGAIRYVYPANMASTNQDSEFDLDDEHTIDFSKLNNQDGTLTTLGSSLDLCVFDGNFSGTNLPASATLTNQLAILAINLKNGTDITSTITDMTISDGTNNYAVSGISSASTIYVAIRPTSGASLSVIATAGTNYYGKYLTGKTYAVNNGYNVTWNMTPLTKVTWDNTNVFVEANQMDWLSYFSSTPLTYEGGITISGVFSYDGGSNFMPYRMGMGDAILDVTSDESCTDSFTFTASGGKNFYKIEITGFPMNLNDANWSLQGRLLVDGSSFIWSKAPSNTVTITASPAYSSTNFDYVTSMVFLTD